MGGHLTNENRMINKLMLFKLILFPIQPSCQNTRLENAIQQIFRESSELKTLCRTMMPYRSDDRKDDSFPISVEFSCWPSSNSHAVKTHSHEAK
jgi:hypothetical protein